MECDGLIDFHHQTRLKELDLNSHFPISQFLNQQFNQFMLSSKSNQIDSRNQSNSNQSISSSNPSSSPSNSSKSPQHVRQKDKIMAACAGGILTSLTMTPLDVIKTRLQTQSPQASTSTSTSTSTPPSLNSGLTSVRRSIMPYLQSSQTSSQQQSKLNSSSNESILRRFDPRALNHSCASLSLSLNPNLSSTHLSDRFNPISSARIPSTSSTLPLIRSFPSTYPSTVPASGIGPTLVMAIPAQAVYMLGYDTLRSHLIKLDPKKASDKGLGPSTGWYPTTIAPLVAGALSRSFVAVLFCPLELLRTQLQSAPMTIKPLTQFNPNQSLSHSKLNPPHHSSLIAKIDLRGLSATLWRDVPFSGIYWSTYELCRKMISDGNGFGESVPTLAHQSDPSDLTIFKIARQSFLAGSISGCLAGIITNPFDVIKTRRQASKSDGPIFRISTLRMIYWIGKHEGLQGLMKGLSPRLTKIIPSCGIMIASYEGLAQVFAQYK
ncbi:mitochondrial carrier domain-containing protein [Melampsora americana]|nr:mitochondrial carrier domain-containing protein [Melampsora americana]